MWAIDVNGTQVEFDGKIAIQLNNPMFSDETSHSLYFTLSGKSDVNRAALGFLNMPEITDNKKRELPCTIKADPIILAGTVVVTYQGGDFNCYFKQNGDFWSAIKDKSLKDIEWDKVTFDPEIGYADMIDYIDTNRESFDYDFTFPWFVNNKVTEKFDIVVSNFNVVNYPLYPATTNYPIIPCMYVRAVYEACFRKHGIDIGKNAFFNTFLRKLVMPNNYMINKFEIDATVASTLTYFITHITKEENPVVTTYAAHGIANSSFIKLGVQGGEIPAAIHDRIFQVEVIDTTSFKLLNENFTAYTEYLRTVFISLYLPEKVFQSLNGLEQEWLEISVDNPEDFAVGMTCYMRSDDWSGTVVLDAKVPDWGNGDFRIVGVWGIDPDWATHTYANLKLIQYKGNETAPVDGTIETLSGLEETFAEIDPSNHVPNITIKDFLDQCKYFAGLIPFIRSNGCDIKTLKEIIKSSDFTDVSEYSQQIRDIENPDMDGYALQMTADSSDSFYKEKVPIQSFDEKYTIKDAVATKSNLTYTGSETNDVRLVTDENSYYVFNKSFLNQDNNWTFLCYNLMDLTDGNGDVKITTKFSSLLPSNLDQSVLKYLQYDVNCSCKAFASSSELALRILIFYGVVEGWVHCSDAAWDGSGTIPSDVFSLRWDGTYGIKERVFKEYIEWLLNIKKDCVTLIIWPMRLLADFDFSKKYQIQSIDYLVKSLKFDLDFKKTRIEYNETELAKV